MSEIPLENVLMKRIRAPVSTTKLGRSQRDCMIEAPTSCLTREVDGELNGWDWELLPTSERRH